MTGCCPCAKSSSSHSGSCRNFPHRLAQLMVGVERGIPEAAQVLSVLLACEQPGPSPGQGSSIWPRPERPSVGAQCPHPPPALATSSPSQVCACICVHAGGL